MKQNRPGLVLIGPVPPPPFGCSYLNQSLLDAAPASIFNFIFIDITDRRPVFNYGKFEVINIYLALKHLAQLIANLIFKKVSVVYLTVATNPLAYLRDGLFIWVAKIFGKKVVVHSHGRENRLFYDRSNFLLKWFIRKTLGFATLAVSEGEIMRAVVFEGLIPNEKIFAVPNGVKDLYQGKDPVHHQGKNGVCKVTYIAHMWEPKGYREILYVAPQIIKKYPNVIFNFAGRWANEEEKNCTEELVKELEISENVRFLGQISDEMKAKLLLESDIFVFPSKFWTEGQPLSVIDAMSAGLPIIASNIGCIPENIPNGENGILIEPGDRTALQEALIMLISDPKKRIDMGAANRRRFLNLYQETNFAQGMEKVFRDALTLSQ